MSRRVVVTGLGLLTPLGRGIKSNWEKLIKGVSGVSQITSFDVTDYSSKIAGQIPVGDKDGEFQPDSVLSPKEQRHVDPFILYGMTAGMDAMTDSGYLPTTETEQLRSGILMGSGIGGVQAVSNGALFIQKQGVRHLTPFLIPSAIINLIGGHLAVKYQFRGPNTTVATACATGTHAIGDAARMILNDEADVMLAGGAEAPICPCGLGGFGQARALTTHYNDTPTKACRPWDKDRDGFILGEGAGALVLEEYEHAKKRGAKIYAELIGYAATCDAYHMTMPGGDGAYLAMSQALKRAHLNPEEVDYINAHGTSTLAGDMVEFRAVKKIFDSTKVSMSSTKSSTGHLLGAAGAVEAIYSILSMQNGIVPATLNLEHPEEETAGFDLVPNQAKEKEVKVVLSNSFGFGGTNGSVIFRKI